MFDADPLAGEPWATNHPVAGMDLLTIVENGHYDHIEGQLVQAAALGKGDVSFLHSAGGVVHSDHALFHRPGHEEPPTTVQLAIRSHTDPKHQHGAFPEGHHAGVDRVRAARQERAARDAGEDPEADWAHVPAYQDITRKSGADLTAIVRPLVSQGSRRGQKAAKASVRLLGGSVGGLAGPLTTQADLTVIAVEMQPATELVVPLPVGQVALLFVHEGGAMIGGRPSVEGHATPAGRAGTARQYAVGAAVQLPAAAPPRPKGSSTQMDGVVVRTTKGSVRFTVVAAPPLHHKVAEDELDAEAELTSQEDALPAVAMDGVAGVAMPDMMHAGCLVARDQALIRRWLEALQGTGFARHQPVLIGTHPRVTHPTVATEEVVEHHEVHEHQHMHRLHSAYKRRQAATQHHATHHDDGASRTPLDYEDGLPGVILADDHIGSAEAPRDGGDL